MAKVSRDILKAIFQTGSKPTEAHFASLIDSFVHLSEDRDLLGLKNYNASQTYYEGDIVVQNHGIYQAIRQTTGLFLAGDWLQLSAAAQQEPATPETGEGDAPLQPVTSPIEFYEAGEESFMSANNSFATKLSVDTGKKRGIYKINWSLIAHHQSNGGLGRFRLMNVTAAQQLGAEIILKQADASERLPLSAVTKIELLNDNQQIELQYQTLSNGERQYISNAIIELTKM